MEKRALYLLAIIGMGFIMLGLIVQILIHETCSQIDKNTDFWVRNCDYE